MNKFDKKLNTLAKSEALNCPEQVTDIIDVVLDSLPERIYKKKVNCKATFIVIGLTALVLLFFVMPNISPSIARAMEDIPIIGSIVKVTTIRNYQYNEGNYNADVKVPSVDVEGIEDNDSVKFINSSVEELTDTLIEQFNKDMDVSGKKGHSALNIDYKVIANNDTWFTLRIRVNEIAASSNTYYEFYHIDKANGHIAQLSNLFTSSDYVKVISDNIHAQISKQMEDDSSLIYWDNAESPEKGFHNIDRNQNFYFSQEGNLVIVFDKYEVAPGYMGCPEFEIPRSIYSDYLKN